MPSKLRDFFDYGDSDKTHNTAYLFNNVLADQTTSTELCFGSSWTFSN